MSGGQKSWPEFVGKDANEAASTISSQGINRSTSI